MVREKLKPAVQGSGETEASGPRFEREQILPSVRDIADQGIEGDDQPEKRFWYIEPVKVGLYSTNSYLCILLVLVPEVRRAVSFPE
jgi:hypothetical protein